MTYRFAETYCSQCGANLGPGDEGVSHCSDHRGPKLTPGRWVATERNPYSIAFGPAFTIDVAEEDGGLVSMIATVGDRWSDKERARANALLLAGSKDLLHALQALVARCDTTELADGSSIDTRAAHAAIDRATGVVDAEVR